MKITSSIVAQLAATRQGQEVNVEIRNEPKSHVVELSQPLPCGTWAGQDAICGRPARAAYLDRDPDDRGAWKLRPVCRVCAAAAAALYQEEAHDDRRR